MPENQTPEQGAQTDAQNTPEQKQNTDAPLGDAGLRALQAERDARKAAEKRAQALEAKVREFEDAEKSELEKAQAKLADATKRAEAAEARLARMEAAIAARLPLDLADRLQGATPEELKADAAKLAALLKVDPEEKREERPADHLDGGARKGPQGGMTRDDVRRLAREDPQKFNEMLEKGQIKLSELA